MTIEEAVKALRPWLIHETVLGMASDPAAVAAALDLALAAFRLGVESEEGGDSLGDGYYVRRAETRIRKALGASP